MLQTDTDTELVNINDNEKSKICHLSLQYISNDIMYSMCSYLTPIQRFKLCTLSKSFHKLFKYENHPFHIYFNIDMIHFIQSCDIFIAKQFISNKHDTNIDYINYLKYILIFWNEFKTKSQSITNHNNDIKHIFNHNYLYLNNNNNIKWLCDYIQFSSKLLNNLIINTCCDNQLNLICNAMIQNKKPNALNTLNVINIKEYIDNIEHETIRSLFDCIAQKCNNLKRIEIFCQDITDGDKLVNVIYNFYEKHHESTHLNYIGIYCRIRQRLNCDDANNKLKEMIKNGYVPVDFYENGLQIYSKYCCLDEVLYKQRNDIIYIDECGVYQCPCCDYYSLCERGGYNICQICWWEDDGVDVHSLDLNSGPNHMTLREGRANFIQFKACDQEMVQNAKKSQYKNDYINTIKHKPRDIPLMIHVAFHKQ